MKKMILLLGLILGICNMGVTAFAEESLVEVLIKTRPETGNVYTGIEQIDMDVYDLTEWRQKRASNEKADKEYIMDTYPTKERLATFVQTEQLKKINHAPYSVDANGEISLSLPRQQNNQDAAYLILSSGETGNKLLISSIAISTPVFFLHCTAYNPKRSSFLITASSLKKLPDRKSVV